MTPLKSLLRPLLLLAWLPAVVQAQVPIVRGLQREWQTVELTFQSPLTYSETGTTNPFLDVRLNVRFTRPDGSQLVVPGFFDADGIAADSSADAGRRWSVRLTPDQDGPWGWEASFRTAPGIAVQPDFGAFGVPVPGSFDGLSGTLEIGPFDPLAKGLRAKGTLRETGTHYLRHAENREVFLKGGANSPENFLGYYEFDNTYDLGGLSPATPDGLHHYDVHLAGFQASDPLDQAAQWKGKAGRRIIGAINYLAAQGVDSVYFLTYSTDGGDSQDTWPWREPIGAGHKLVYDVSKLAQWERVFTHMSARGIVMHLVLQELENDQTMGGLTTERMLYHRELVARFAHHQGLLWNIGEENTSPAAEQIAFADHLRSLDPYDHPITVHNQVGQLYSTYQALWNTSFRATSIQSSPTLYNTQVKDMRTLSSAAGSPFAVFCDESFSPSIAANMSNLAVMRDLALWGVFLGGGAGVEWFFPFGDQTLEDYRVAAPLWGDNRNALDFLRRYVHVEALLPNDALTLEPDDHLLEEPGETYVVYRPAGGGATLVVPDLELYDVQWFDPREGGPLKPGLPPQAVATASGGQNLLSTGAPPDTPGLDWVCLVRKSANRAPVVTEFRVAPEPVAASGPIVIRIRVQDPDGPDDLSDVGLVYQSPQGDFGTAYCVPRGGDLYTLSRNSASTLQAGTWICLAAATDKAGALSSLPGLFTIVP